MNTISIQYLDTPCGKLLLGGYDGRLCLCDWASNRRRALTDARICRALKAVYAEEPSAVTARAMEELREYFGGSRMAFDVPLLMLGTPFQRQVWQCLLTIPYGTTLSYAAEAARMGRQSAVRAVASANAANPISILVPCHRVVASSGTLAGYAGGVEAKRRLLALEQARLEGGR